MRYVIIALAILICTTACTTVPSNHNKSTQLVLPDVRGYSKEDMAKVAAELQRCGKLCITTTEFMKDYKIMRDETRLALHNLK